MSRVTCHGTGAKEGRFELRNPKLPTLNCRDHLRKHEKGTPKPLEFTMEGVTPQQATALEEPGVDPEANTGFGCGGCHTLEK